jgi:1-acyl-sn-glycerol-3-phosphate acyltransferase
MLRLLHPWLPVRIDDPSTALRHAPCILVANHQSFLDIYLLGAQDQSDLCLVSKSWPHRLLFFFAPMMRSAGYIDAQSLDAATVHARCRERIADGATLVFFPEGRRSRDGNLGRFHAGAFLLALEEGVPVVPLAIMDSFRACPPGSLRFRPGGIHMAVLPPMHPPRADDPLAHRTFMRSVRTAFLQALPEGADGQGHAPHGESPDNTARPPHGNAVQSSPIP